MHTQHRGSVSLRGFTGWQAGGAQQPRPCSFQSREITPASVDNRRLCCETIASLHVALARTLTLIPFGLMQAARPHRLHQRDPAADRTKP
jgi:hypothetical protein